MSDLISRATAIETIKKLASNIAMSNQDANYGIKRMARQTMKALADLPTAEPDSLYTVTIDEGKLTWKTGVTRCKHCRYYEIVQLTRSGQDDRRYKPSVCTRGKYAVSRNENWFCADAERRTDEDQGEGSSNRD